MAFPVQFWAESQERPRRYETRKGRDHSSKGYEWSNVIRSLLAANAEQALYGIENCPSTEAQLRFARCKTRERR
jgi:hypothetical protein